MAFEVSILPAHELVYGSLLSTTAVKKTMRTIAVTDPLIQLFMSKSGIFYHTMDYLRNRVTREIKFLKSAGNPDVKMQVGIISLNIPKDEFEKYIRSDKVISKLLSTNWGDDVMSKNSVVGISFIYPDNPNYMKAVSKATNNRFFIDYDYVYSTKSNRERLELYFRLVPIINIKLQELSAAEIKARMGVTKARPVGKSLFGGRDKVNLYFDQKPEPDTDFEERLYTTLDSWYASSDNSEASFLAKNRPLLKKIRAQFPKILDPGKRRVYRGIDAYDFIQKNKSAINTTIEKGHFDIIRANDELYIAFYANIKSIRKAESWSTNIHTAMSFHSSCILVSTTTEGDFYVEPEASNIIGGHSEDETIRIVDNEKNVILVFLRITDYVYDIDDLIKTFEVNKKYSKEDIENLDDLVDSLDIKLTPKARRAFKDKFLSKKEKAIIASGYNIHDLVDKYIKL